MQSHHNFFSKFLLCLLALLTLTSIAIFAYYWDPTRVWIKKFTTSDPYRYDQVNPEFLKVNPSSLINISDKFEMAQKRKDLIKVVWGEKGLPVTKLPDRVDRNILSAKPPYPCHPYEIEHPYPEIITRLGCSLDLYRGMANLDDIDHLHLTLYRDAPVYPVFPNQGNTGDYGVSIAHFRPRQGNGKAVIVQYGLAGTYHNLNVHLASLVEHGYAVFALNVFNYGDNLKDGSARGSSNGLPVRDLPFRVYFEPVAMVVNYALQQNAYNTIDMIGFSTGAWITAVSAAMDPRIRRSYPVAGVYPMYLRTAREQSQMDLHHPLIAKASYLEMFTMASIGAGRGQMQIFNQYDRCCFRNELGLLYKEVVKSAIGVLGQGAHFDVRIDRGHARHKISQWAMNAILNDMESGSQP